MKSNQAFKWSLQNLLRICGFLLLLNSWQFAFADVLDRVDLIERENDGDMVIRFSQKILYLRHTVTDDKKNIRIFIRLAESNLHETELVQEVIRSPKSARFEAITVMYPELINGMLISFKLPVNAVVKPGDDGRSIILTVPLLAKSSDAVKSEAAKKKENRAEQKLPAAISSANQLGVKLQKKDALNSKAIDKPVESKVSSENTPKSQTENTIQPTLEYNTAAPIPLSTDIDVEKKAQGFLIEAQAAFHAKDYVKAINRLNRILGMPTSTSTEPAQALIGEVRERNGENMKAKGEYELYIKLFPEGPNITKIKKLLSVLPKEAGANRQAQKSLPAEAGVAEWTYNANLAAYYYTGKSQIETLTPPAPGQLTFNRDTLSLVDQNSLISSINLNARRRDGFTDTRFIFRDTDNNNFLNRSRSYNRLYSAYVDHVDRKLGYYVRLGRQNPNGMGVLDRFDGVQAGYNIGSNYRANFVYGNAVEFGSPFKKSFYGVSADMQPQIGVPGVSVYAIQQTLDGVENRRALGTEVRYFDSKFTTYGMLDYDVLYKGINIALLQGNYLSESGNNYFFVLDHRRAPTFSLTNALQAAPGLSLREMIASQGVAEVRGQAAALTAMSDMFAIGVTRQATEKWQLGVDYRLSSISSTQPVMAVLPLAVIGVCLGRIDTINNTCVIDTSSQQASGMNHVITLQAVGSNLFLTNAVGVSNISFIKAPSYTGQASSLAYAMPFLAHFKLDTNLRYYTQKDNADNKQDRLSYSLKLSYQWRSSLYFEGEAGREVSNSTGSARNDHSTRDYVFFGLRGDFR